MAEIVPVTSESLEATVRSLLPSQRGFGEDLQASNVITPIIDLTPSAEGTTVPEYQAQAICFGSATAFASNNSTVVVANTPGFYRIFVNITHEGRSAGSTTAIFNMTDGLSTKVVWASRIDATTSPAPMTQNLDFVVFLAAGESLTAQTTVAEAWMYGSSRQIADVNGNVVLPVGFSPQ